MNATQRIDELLFDFIALTAPTEDGDNASGSEVAEVLIKHDLHGAVTDDTVDLVLELFERAALATRITESTNEYLTAISDGDYKHVEQVLRNIAQLLNR